MRAARFASQLGFEIAPDVLQAIKDMSGRISIISAERIRDEFTKLLISSRPRIGITLLVETGLAEIVLPEIPKLRLEIDEHHHHKDVYEHSITVLEQAIAHEERLGAIAREVGFTQISLILDLYQSLVDKQYRQSKSCQQQPTKTTGARRQAVFATIQRQRQTDIAKTDDADNGGAVLEFPPGRHRGSGGQCDLSPVL